ncbi:hypothetical protein NM208_g13757 [Fusarium decemcellulare]|uniref:Uncharacterized protein n=1 Tax=Fusarium decemcellulare TaxID=57161 RepID=A0ACC1RK24_9HYPO|nr:hypothetical protein NM208_g13757 [Fusarium decemcellulare]
MIAEDPGQWRQTVPAGRLFSSEAVQIVSQWEIEAFAAVRRTLVELCAYMPDPPGLNSSNHADEDGAHQPTSGTGVETAWLLLEDKTRGTEEPETERVIQIVDNGERLWT